MVIEFYGRQPFLVLFGGVNVFEAEDRLEECWKGVESLKLTTNDD